MNEIPISRQSIADAAELAFIDTTFRHYDPRQVSGTNYDVLEVKARAKGVFDPEAECVAHVYEVVANVVELPDMFTDHRLAIEWRNGDQIEFSLDTGLLVGDPDEPKLYENTEKQKPVIMRILNKMMTDAA